MADDLSSLIKGITKDLKGAATISQLSEVETPFETRYPTGILSLDIELNGGLPGGSLVQVFGPDGVGKDYLTNLTMAQVQKEYGDSANSAGMTFGYKPDLGFMQMAGVDPDLGNILYIDTDLAAEDHPAESLLDAMLKLLRSGKFQLMIINELGSGETKYNVVKNLGEDAKIATWASLMSSFCQKYYTNMRMPLEDGGVNKTCVVMINPVRANLDARSARFNPWTQGGGFALKHAKAVDIHLRQGATIKTQKEGKIGKEVKWKISKGKHGLGEGAEGSSNFMFENGVDLVADLANVAKAYGVIRSSGPIYYIMNSEEKIKGGLDGVIEILKKDPELAHEVRCAVLQAARG